jgi:hypothetical protein
VSEKQKEKES